MSPKRTPLADVAPRLLELCALQCNSSVKFRLVSNRCLTFDKDRRA